MFYFLFLLAIPHKNYVVEVLFPINNFNCEISPDLHFLSFLRSEICFLKNGLFVCMHVRVCIYLCAKYSEPYTSKTKVDRNISYTVPDKHINISHF